MKAQSRPMSRPLAVFLAAALSSVAVATFAASQDDSMSPEAKAGAKSSQAATSDSEITYEVNNALQTDPATRSASINVDTTSGVVSLTGTVPDSKAKLAAHRIASAVNGVRSVQDRLTVGGTPSDME